MNTKYIIHKESHICILRESGWISSIVIEKEEGWFSSEEKYHFKYGDKNFHGEYKSNDLDEIYNLWHNILDQLNEKN